MKTPEWIDQYDPENRAYILCHYAASEGTRTGEFKTYCVGHNHQVGRYIDVKTDQGWTTIYTDESQNHCEVTL